MRAGKPRIFVSLLPFLFCVNSALAEAKETAVPVWQHPGVLVSKAQLDFVKQQVNAHVEPFYQEFLNAQASNYGKKSYIPKGPYTGGIIQCGFYSSPDYGCTDASNDSAAAYVQALLWYITDDQAYATNAINIMNTYSHNLKAFVGYTAGYPCPSANTCSNAPLQAAWDGEKWPRAAEIIRYGKGGSAGWAAADIAAFSSMLKNLYEPLIYNGASQNGNWELSMIDAMMGIAVFNEDLALWQHAQQFWTQRVPAYFYNYILDNPLYPNTHAPFPSGRQGFTTWNGQLVFNSSTTGVSQETCRDLKHTEDGIAAAINAAETDYIQGGTLTANLYTANGAQQRLVTSLNLMAGMESGASTTAPANFCTGSGNKLTLGIGTTYVIGYNEYHNRLNDPNMANGSGTTGLNGTANTYHWIQNGLLPQKLASDGGTHPILFEPLTHYANASSSPVFSLALGSSSQTVMAGGSATYTLNVSAVSGYSENVTLSVVSTLPSGITASFNPAVIKGGSGSSSLTVVTNSEVASGSYALQIAGTDGKMTRTVTATLVVEIAGKTAVIQADNQTMAQGGNLPSLTYSVSPSVTFTTPPSCVTTATSTSPQGSYPITCSGAVATGYTFSYVPGTLTVNAAGGLTCSLVSSSVTAIQYWGKTRVDSFNAGISLAGFSGSKLAVSGTVVMKNTFQQNFWSSAGFTASFSGNTGQFSGTLYANSGTGKFTLNGFLADGTPLVMNVGDNPVESLIINGVTCQ